MGEPRKLLTRTEFAAMRDSSRYWSPPDTVRLLDAYETAVRLLEECVRDDGPRDRDPLGPLDVAWLALRETER